MKKVFFIILAAVGLCYAQATNEVYVEQITTFGDNNADVNQMNGAGNLIHAVQNALCNNELYVLQENGTHSLKLEDASSFNEAFITQKNGSGSIWLKRSSLSGNTIPDADNTQMDNPSERTGIYQDGNNNYITGVAVTGCLDPTVAVDLNKPAKQTSVLGSNWLEVWQVGDNNKVGLNQRAGCNNVALINQQNDNNDLAVFQFAVAGSNHLEVLQTGNTNATIYQKSFSGGNRAIVIQN